MSMSSIIAIIILPKWIKHRRNLALDEIETTYKPAVQTIIDYILFITKL